MNVSSSSEPTKAKDIEKIKMKEKKNAIKIMKVGPRGTTPARVTVLRVLGVLSTRMWLPTFVFPKLVCLVDKVLAEELALRRPVVDKKE